MTWKSEAAKVDDPSVFGTAVLPYFDVHPLVGGFKVNQFAYAHAYLFAPKAGTVRAIVEHSFGMKVWLNGEVVYREPQRRDGLGFYPSLSRDELGAPYGASPRFDVTLKQGWNRLLVKIGTPKTPGYNEQRFCLRFNDLPTVEYDSENIAWMAELPGRSSSTPILVGDRLFVASEPDALTCLDRVSGKLLWSATTNLYDTVTDKDREAQPAFAKTVEPLAQELNKETDRLRRHALRHKIQKALEDIDAKRFKHSLDGHFESHFGIVGFSLPTPVSDGKFVYVWNGMGIAACFDLEGRRQWITRIPGELSYASSPTLIDGTFSVFMNRLYGLDAKTGEIKWQQKRINRNNASILPARLAGTPCIVTQRGDIVRAADGVILWHRTREDGTGDTGWSAPVVLGDIIYSLKYGVTNLSVIDCAGMTGDAWQPKVTPIPMPESVSRKANGGWIDRWTAGSPLIYDGRSYIIDIWSSMYAVDLPSKKMLYQHDTGLGGFFHYNSLPVAASPTLIGDRIVVQNNQGTALVLQPGSKYEVVSKNHIGTILDRRWALPGQETIGYAPPITDGERLYIRGERYLYCIAK